MFFLFIADYPFEHHEGVLYKSRCRIGESQLSLIRHLFLYKAEGSKGGAGFLWFLFYSTITLLPHHINKIIIRSLTHQ